MTFEVIVPTMGESIVSGVVADWRVEAQEAFSEGDILLEIETDKVTVEIPAPHSGVLTELRVSQGQEVKIGEVLAVGLEKKSDSNTPSTSSPSPSPSPSAKGDVQKVLTPELRRLVAEKQISSNDLRKIHGTGRRGNIVKADIIGYLQTAQKKSNQLQQANRKKREGLPSSPEKSEEALKIVPMSPIRKRIAERLLQAQRSAAILTTFNEIDMTAILAIRVKYKAIFFEKHQVKLGFTSIFAKIVCEVLAEIPALNAEIQDENIVYYPHCHIGIAVGGPKGLIVPVIRSVEKKNHAEIEREVSEKVQSISDGSISLHDLEGGTFTISNGGIYGSMLSTPILNPPQVGILGLHNIVKRPVVIKDSTTQKEEITIRPIMYVALSYDHRLVDGKEAVTFLRRTKELAEDPQRIWLSM